jgi:glycosyltransferase involved in cell wall biosynthesis
MSAPSPTVSVLVPTWRRPESVARCLRAIVAQTRAPLEIIVITRDVDPASRAAASAVAVPAGVALRVLEIPAGGVVAAMQAGLDAARGGIIALTDDDAEPRRDWIERLVAALGADAGLAGAGGRDWQPHERGDATVVGRVQWFGRVIGRHHLGAGAPQDVDVLKGVNCAYRATLLKSVGFDRRLRGAGAQLHWELGIGLPLRRAGWRLRYDPAIAVEHHVEVRSSDDQLHRGAFAADALVDAVHNEALLVGEHLGGAARLAWHLWATAIGSVAAPGLLNAVRLRAQGKRWAWAAWRAARRGGAEAHQTHRRSPRRFDLPRPGTPA